MKTPGHPVGGVTQDAKGCVISLTVLPRSSANRIEIDANGVIKVRLTAPPVDGAANTALLKFLASVLDVPRGNLSIVSGSHARHKRLLAEGIHADSARTALACAAQRNT